MRDSEVAARPPAAVRVVDPAAEGALAHHLLRAAEGGDVALGATQYAALMGMVQRSSSVPSDALPRVRGVWERALAAGLHCTLLTFSVPSLQWAAACLLSAAANTILGGYGHNAVHRMEPAAALLDWNGLSAYEWIHEHVHSHHMYVNTAHDHDAHSMAPFLHWTPSSSPSLLAARGKHAIYLISELAVALRELAQKTEL